jgi:hypothetical protein
MGHLLCPKAGGREERLKSPSGNTRVSRAPISPWLGLSYSMKAIVGRSYKARGLSHRASNLLTGHALGHYSPPIGHRSDLLKCLPDFQRARALMRVIKSAKSGEVTRPTNFRLMPVIGNGVEEIRVSSSSGAYGVISLGPYFKVRQGVAGTRQANRLSHQGIGAAHSMKTILRELRRIVRSVMSNIRKVSTGHTFFHKMFLNLWPMPVLLACRRSTTATGPPRTQGLQLPDSPQCIERCGRVPCYCAPSDRMTHLAKSAVLCAPGVGSPCAPSIPSAIA